MSDRRHEAWLKFQRDILTVAAGRSKQELFEFRHMAERDHPALARLIDAYLDLAHRSDTDVRLLPQAKVRRTKKQPMHLFDLLREKTFFPQNLDLARFASRVLPHMRSYRFDKMSRSDIAARIVEYIEESDPNTREILETSMRDALESLSGKQTRPSDRKSFLSQWEKIIKGAY